MNLQTIITKLKADLQEVVDDGKLGAVYDYPKDQLDVSPAAVFYPIGADNAYHSTHDNKKTYNFVVAVHYQAQKGTDTTKKKLYTELMPPTVDAIVQKLDEKWNVGNVGGRIMWMTITNLDWIYSTDEAGGHGLTVVLQLTYEITNDI